MIKNRTLRLALSASLAMLVVGVPALVVQQERPADEVTVTSLGLPAPVVLGVPGCC